MNQLQNEKIINNNKPRANDMRIADLAILHFTHNALRTFGGIR